MNDCVEFTNTASEQSREQLQMTVEVVAGDKEQIAEPTLNSYTIQDNAPTRMMASLSH